MPRKPFQEVKAERGLPAKSRDPLVRHLTPLKVVNGLKPETYINLLLFANMEG